MTYWYMKTACSSVNTTCIKPKCSSHHLLFIVHIETTKREERSLLKLQLCEVLNGILLKGNKDNHFRISNFLRVLNLEIYFPLNIGPENVLYTHWTCILQYSSVSKASSVVSLLWGCVCIWVSVRVFVIAFVFLQTIDSTLDRSRRQVY